MREVIAECQRLARALLRQFTQAEAGWEDDLVSHVQDQLLEQTFDPTRGRFCGWVRSVVRNRLLDLIRGRRRTVALADAEPSVPDSSVSIDQAIDCAAPFNSRDLASIRGWNLPTSRKIAILCLTLIWEKIPSDEWNSWVDECDLEPPFPPEGFSESSLTLRITSLASTFGVRRDLIITWCSRYRHYVRNLEFSRSLRDDRNGGQS